MVKSLSMVLKQQNNSTLHSLESCSKKPPSKYQLNSTKRLLNHHNKDLRKMMMAVKILPSKIDINNVCITSCVFLPVDWLLKIESWKCSYSDLRLP